MSRFCVLALLALTTLVAQTEPAKPDAAKPESLILKPERTIEFDTDEATWMSIDVSPDGKTLLVDLLGDLYTLPVTGGDLKPLTTGMQWDYQARYSPDGKHIAFISDRGGSDNVWIMNSDGSNPKALTKEKKYMFGSPAWSPDGQYVVARRNGVYPTDSYLRSTQLWMFHKDGGSGIQLTKGDARFTRTSGPAFSHDGKYLYFAATAGRFQYNADPGKWQLQRLNRETAEVESLTSSYGGGFRPTVSPDGKMLLYATRHDNVTGLRLRTLADRSERWLARRITRDDQESFATEDVLPNYGWTRDGQSVYIAIDGKIHRIGVPSGKDEIVPFTCHVNRGAAARIEFDDQITESPMTVRQMRWLHESSDQATQVFSALGRIFVASNGASPKRLTKSEDREFAPEISPDGQWIAYVTWSDQTGGRLWKAPVSGGAPVELSRSAAFYSLPVWSHDGSRLAFVMGSAAGWLSEESSETYELKTIPAAGGEIATVTHMRSPNSRVAWSADDKRLYYDESIPPNPAVPDSQPSTALISIRTDGVDKKTHVRFPELVSATPSPDEKYVLVTRLSNLYVLPLPKGTLDPVQLSLDAGQVPVKQVTATGANYARWMGNNAICYAFVNHLYRVQLADVLASTKVAELKPAHVDIDLSAPRHIAHGVIVLSNARVLTMKGAEVLDHADIVVTDNRITAIGPHGKVAIPAGARTIDATGKTIMPGIVDIHAHLHAQGDIFPDKVWPYAANLAYGVTTTRDPSIESNRVFPYAEMVESGEIAGPRIYSTGSPMTTTLVKIESLEDAQNAVKRYKEQGADFLKQYMQPRRIQRQWIQQAARENHINLTAEGGGFMKEDLAMAIDGYTGFEHNLPYELHKDVIELMARTQATYTPTLIVSYGSPFGQYYWRQKRNYHNDPKLSRFTPHEELDRKARRVVQSPDEDYFFPVVAKGAAQILRAGGGVALGSHGEQQGIGAHWELWMLASGGMKPMEVLQVATIGGAKAIRLDKDLGSLETGKLADLIVLDANPLDDIHNSEKIRYVMKNGELFDGSTLDRIWPDKHAYGKFYWQASE